MVVGGGGGMRERGQKRRKIKKGYRGRRGAKTMAGGEGDGGRGNKCGKGDGKRREEVIKKKKK